MDLLNIKVPAAEVSDITKSLYEKTVKCPICGQVSKNLAVKKGSYRVTGTDSDFMVNYIGINPLFYEVKYCKVCGYSALTSFFEAVNEKEKVLIKEKISSKWVMPSYPEFFDEDYAVKQFQLALLNSMAKGGPASEKGILCLKLSWIFRLKMDPYNERRFQLQAAGCFEEAYKKENFPISGLDECSLLYLIGELYRRTGDNEKALSYFSMVLTSKQASAKIKDKVRDQKELITSNK